LSYLANTQTDKHTEKHNLLGGGNNIIIINSLSCCWFDRLMVQ